MAKVLVLYYLSYGHIERMAEAEAEGARGAGTQADIRRVPELAPRSVAKLHTISSIRWPRLPKSTQLANYDAIIFGTPTRFGNMAAQISGFIDQAGSLWMKDKLVGKVGSVFVATAAQHGRLDRGAALRVQGTDEHGRGGLRMPSAAEIEAARFQGRHVAVIADGCGRARMRDVGASAVAAA